MRPAPSPRHGGRDTRRARLAGETDGIGAAAPAVEAVAQLEAEVEYKRQQVAAQLVELRDREQQLRAATNEIERVRRELATIRNELDESRATAARLERAVIDKDRALEARDARIVTLHEELKQRLGNVEKVGTGAGDSAAPKLDPLPVRAGPIEPAADNVTGPALLCLTGDAPKRFPLTKKAVTIGRGPQCDLQILTHFVSREHARITSSAGRVLIEDARQPQRRLREFRARRSPGVAARRSRYDRRNAVPLRRIDGTLARDERNARPTPPRSQRGDAR